MVRPRCGANPEGGVNPEWKRCGGSSDGPPDLAAVMAAAFPTTVRVALEPRPRPKAADAQPSTADADPRSDDDGDVAEWSQDVPASPGAEAAAAMASSAPGADLGWEATHFEDFAGDLLKAKEEPLGSHLLNKAGRGV